MSTNERQRSRLWLAGWYTVPGGECNYVNRKCQAAPWPQAADWLRAELGALAGRIDPAPVSTVHVTGGAVIQDLSFEDCREFIEWAMHERRERGIFGRDAHRVYYLIADDEAGAHLPADLTPPLLPQASLAPSSPH